MPLLRADVRAIFCADASAMVKCGVASGEQPGVKLELE